MQKRTWLIGAQLIGKVMEVHPGEKPNIPRLTVVEVEFAGGSKEAFIMVWVWHEIAPVVGHGVTIQFMAGGPTGGYWKIIK